MHHISKLIAIFLIVNLLACESPSKKVSVSLFDYVLPQASYAIKINKKNVIQQTNPIILGTYLNQADKDFLAYANFKLPYIINILQNNSKIKGFVAIGRHDSLHVIFKDVAGTYDQFKIYKTTFHNHTYYGTQIKNINLISNQRLLLENTIRDQDDFGQLSHNKNFLKGLKSLDDNAALNLIVLTEQLKPDTYFESLLKFKWTEIGNWFFYDLVDTKRQIATGLCISENNNSIINSLFKKNTPDNQKIVQLLPFSIDAYLSFSFDNYEQFSEQLSLYKLYTSEQTNPNKQKFESLKAFCFFNEKSNKAIILYLETLSDLIGEEPIKVKEFNNYDLYKFDNPELINSQFSGFLPKMNAKFFSLVDGKIIITETQAYLEKIINDYQNHSTLAKSQTYSKLQAEIPDNYHLVLFKNKVKIDGQSFMKALTFKVENNLCFTNLVLQNIQGTDGQGLVEQVLTYSMDKRPPVKPQLVFNHKTKHFNIIYQDANKYLNFINLKGRTLWQLPLKDFIIGPIKQVDLFKNKKIQYTFVTPHEWYIIDRLGRTVDNFPKHFKTEITQGISVFDYDRNRKYRFGLTQGKYFNLYDNEGHKVKGFNFKALNKIAKIPQHFRINNKDFILLQDQQGHLYLINRRGQQRIKIKQKFNTKQNDWNVYQQKFVTIDDDNNLIAIDLSGNIKKAKLDLGDHILSDIKANTMAAIAGNKLLLNKKIKDLDLGTYNPPEIYQIPKQTYIFVANKDNNKIYAFNKKGQLLKNFPIIGQQVLDFKYNQNGKYLLVYDSANNLILYKF